MSVTETKAALTGDLAEQLALGNYDAATAKAAQLVRLGISDTLPKFSDFVDAMAEAMKTNPGKTNGLSDKAAVVIYGKLVLLGVRELANVVFSVAADRAAEINAAVEYGRTPRRPIKDNPQA